MKRAVRRTAGWHVVFLLAFAIVTFTRIVPPHSVRASSNTTLVFCNI